MDNQWYTNKELFEKMLELSGEVGDLRKDLGETREIIKRYNGLREEIENVRRESTELDIKVMKIINSTHVKNVFVENLRNWGGWIFGLITLFVLLYNQLL